MAFFTITQPFLGAPLQFQPALGSQELEQLIDAFVTGSSSKKDKLSEVTIDFYNNATVDLNTGALVRRYDVALSSPWATQPFEQSPTFSQSSGFSPSMYTPSPASSATFGDSGYGSISMTPPTRNRGSRVSKKAKKDTKKTQEVRLPGFSIMTKDGVDVTSTAGRGTKTKEQREHAHLMRIMKACDDCKRKKIRCDPSHRRTDMSRTSTSTTKTSESSRASVPSLSHESTYTSQESTTPPSFNTNPIDDFVLFPEDTAFSWNPADMSLGSQAGDLGQFNFDINDIDLEFSNNFPTNSESFDFSFDQQPTFSEQPSYATLANDQDGFDQWAGSFGDQSAIHTRPHPSSSSGDSGQLDSSWYSDSFGSNDSASPISPRTCPPLSSVPGGNTSYSTDNSQILHTNSSSTSPTDSSSLDWSVYDATPFANISTHANQDLSAPASSQSSQNRTNCSSRKRALSEEPDFDVSSGHSHAGYPPLALDFYDPGLSDSPSDGLGQTLSSSSSSNVLPGMNTAYAVVLESLQAFPSSSSPESRLLTRELLQLRATIDQVKQTRAIVADSVMSHIRDLISQLHTLSANVVETLQSSGVEEYQPQDRLDPETRDEYLRQSQVNARRLVRSLCATISNLQANTDSAPTSNTRVLTSGRNLALTVSPFDRHNRGNVTSISAPEVEFSYVQSSTHSSSSRYGVILQEDGYSNALDLSDVYEEACEGSANAIESSGLGQVVVRKSPAYARLQKESLLDSNSRSSPFFDQVNDQSGSYGQFSQVTSLGALLEESARAAQIAPIIVANATLSQQQSQLTATNAVDQLTTSVIQTEHLRTEDSPRATSQDRSCEVSPGGAIPQAVPEMEYPLAASSNDMKYSMLVALALSASLVILNGLQETLLSVMHNMSLLVPLSFLAVAFPRQLSPVNMSWICLAALALSSSVRLDTLRETCNQWIDNDSFFAMAKLFLCCVVVAQSPSFLWEELKGYGSLAVIASLLRFSSISSLMTSPPKSFSGQSSRSPFSGNELASLFGMLSSSVQVV